MVGQRQMGGRMVLKQLNVRLPEDELEHIRNKSKDARMTVNGYIRHVLREAEIEVKVRCRDLEEGASCL